MGALRHAAEEVEEAVRVLQVGHRRRLQRVNHVRELDRVTDKEDGRVVAHEVPVAFVRVELGGEAARIAHGLGRSLAVDHRGEPHRHRRAFAGAGKHLGGGQIGKVSFRDKFSLCCGAACVHHALGNPLPMEALELLDQVDVLQQRRTVRSGGLGVLVVADGRAVVARHGLGTGGEGKQGSKAVGDGSECETSESSHFVGPRKCLSQASEGAPRHLRWPACHRANCDAQ
ncbi:hypothetical protein D3C81_1085340 [compost metagenome]